MDAEPLTHDASAFYLGIDPGLNRTGYALIRRSARGPRLHEGGIIRSSRADSLARRVHEIATGLQEVVAEFQPAMVAIEQVFSFGKNPKTALLLAHVRGAILATLVEAECPVVHYTPTQIKKLLTGNGRASKEQIQHAIRNEMGLKSVLEPNDVADAAAIALCVFHSVKFTSNVA